jgi:hypothetical protein
MKTFLLLFLSLLLTLPARPILAQDLTQQQPSREAAAQEIRRQEILHQAPLVFLGREVESQEYKEDNRLHQTTLIQLLEVLRGEPQLQPGFVELLRLSPQTDQATIDRFQNGQQLIINSLEHGQWGIYFCSPAALPHTNSPYRTNNRQPVVLFQQDEAAAITSSASSHGQHTGGLYRSFAGEEAVQAFLATTPRLKRLTKSVNAYPERPFVDVRPQVQARRVAEEAAARAAEEAAEQQERARGATPCACVSPSGPSCRARTRTGARFRRKSYASPTSLRE